VNAGALITIVVFFTIVSLSAFFSIRLGWHEEKQRRKKQAQAAKLALQLHPTYRQKLAEDREYELKKERQTVYKPDFN
jgi:type II secretory pathway component PulL